MFGAEAKQNDSSESIIIEMHQTRQEKELNTSYGILEDSAIPRNKHEEEANYQSEIHKSIISPKLAN